MPATETPAGAGARRSSTTAARGPVANATTATASGLLAHCRHQPTCPSSDAPDRYRAHVVAFHPEQGWSLLCNGVIVFDDLGALVPGCDALPAQRPAFAGRRVN
jgi:hypothetical protein